MKKPKYPIPFNIATKVQIVNGGRYDGWKSEIGKIDLIQEVSDHGDPWAYALCRTGAWLNHSQLKKISDPTEETVEDYFKAIEESEEG